MMYIQNIGSKIVNVGSIVLLPGKQMKASDEVAMSGPVQALVKRGHLRTVKPKVKATTTAATATVTDSAAKQADTAPVVTAAKKRAKKAADTAEAANTTETTAAQEG